MEQQNLADLIGKQYSNMMQNEFETGFLEQDQNRFPVPLQQGFPSKKQEQPSDGHRGRTQVQFPETDDTVSLGQQHLDVPSNLQDLAMLSQSQITQDQPDIMTQQGIAQSWQYEFNNAKERHTYLICDRYHKHQQNILGHMSCSHKLNGPGSSRCTEDKTRSKYVCSICLKLFTSKGEALSHILHGHPGEVLLDRGHHIPEDDMVVTDQDHSLRLQLQAPRDITDQQEAVPKGRSVKDNTKPPCNNRMTNR
jgi:hypothetical protein